MNSQTGLPRSKPSRPNSAVGDRRETSEREKRDRERGEAKGTQEQEQEQEQEHRGNAT